MTPKRCTCAPHPRVDLTEAYLLYHRNSCNEVRTNSDQPNCLGEINSQVRAACSSHGCFHVTIRHPISCDGSTAHSSPVTSLAKGRADIEHEIEELFSQSFLKCVIGSTHDLSDREWGDVCNGKTTNVAFYNNSSSKHIQHGTFRGRSAESGDEENSKPEPKLSWEFQRCIKQLEHKYQASKDASIDKEWSSMSEWTDALHSIAATVIYILGIPPGLVLQEEPCKCWQSQNNTQLPLSDQQCKCNIDLLRVFRYDSIEDTDLLHGSSAHSDWGSLTVVWQDDRGGLQTYCEACDKWSDVDASSAAPIGSDDANSSENGTINLFVHVGDFLSLASMQSSGSPAWHSPRHRVLCPVRSISDSTTSSDAFCFDKQCRRSLVYFAYPPPGVSLRDAQEEISCIASVANGKSSLIPSSIDCLNSYSVLHDQSLYTATAQDSELRVKTSYDKILNMPFDQVVAQKWSQVQRK